MPPHLLPLRFRRFFRARREEELELVKKDINTCRMLANLSGLQDAVWRFSLLVGLVVVVTSMLYMAWGLVYEQPIWIEDKDGMRRQTGRATTTGR